MSEVSYYAILEALRDILITDTRSRAVDGSEVKVLIEEDFIGNADLCPVVMLSLISTETPEDREMIGGKNPFRTFLNIELSLVTFALDNNKESCGRRDRIFKKIKEVLKENRTIRDTVLISWFGGAEFTAHRDGNHFFNGVDLTLKCEIRE